MNQEPVKLTMEQEFSLKSFETQVEKMSKEQAQHFLVKLYEQMLVRDALYKQLFAAQWQTEMPTPGDASMG